MSKMPTVGLVYIQTVSVRANVAKRHASKLSPSDLNLDAPNGNGPFLVWSAHVKLAHCGKVFLTCSRPTSRLPM